MVGVGNNRSTALFQDSSTGIFDCTHGFLMFKLDKDQHSVLLPILWLCKLSLYIKFLVTC